MTLEEGLELIENYKKGLKKFMDLLPEQSVQLGPEMIKTLSMNSKNEIKNLTKNQNYSMKPFSEIISKIIAAGGLFKYKP